MNDMTRLVLLANCRREADAVRDLPYLTPYLTLQMPGLRGEDGEMSRGSIMYVAPRHFAISHL